MVQKIDRSVQKSDDASCTFSAGRVIRMRRARVQTAFMSAETLTECKRYQWLNLYLHLLRVRRSFSSFPPAKGADGDDYRTLCLESAGFITVSDFTFCGRVQVK